MDRDLGIGSDAGPDRRGDRGGMVAFIVGGEIAFWVVLLAALAVRYLLRMRRLSTVLLIGVPLVDLVLFVASALDLARGATADFSHGLAAAYIGFSVAFGHSLVRWADQRFAHRFAGAPPPVKPPKHGRARVVYEWREFAKGAAGWAVACGLLWAAILLVDDPARTAALNGWIGRLTVVMVIWLIFWPVLETVFPSRARGESRASRR
jgi:hypothetical protein